MRKLVTILLVLCLFFTTATLAQTDNAMFETNSLANWTVMFYMAGEVQNMDAWLLPTIENLTKIKSDSNLNIVILYDGFESGDVKLYYINETGSKIVLNDEYGWPDEVDTSSLNTLETFCIQMMNNYPANHYALIPTVSGGTGWQLMCLHDAHDGGIGVSIPDFADALDNIVEETGSKIDVLRTSCAMNMVEVVYELRNSVDYIVGTEDCLSSKYLIPRFYNPVRDLKNDTSMSPLEFASKFPEQLDPIEFYYQEEYDEMPLLNKIFNRLPFPKLHSVKYYDSSAVVDLIKVENLTDSIDNLADFLILNNYNHSTKQSVADSWDEVKKFGKCLSKNSFLRIFHRRYHFEFSAYEGFIDIYHFAQLLKNNTENIHLKNLCDNLMDAFNESIPVFKGVDGDPSYGLSMYFPTKNTYNKYSVFTPLPCFYEGLEFAEETSWDEFLKTYLNIQ